MKCLLQPPSRTSRPRSCLPRFILIHVSFLQDFAGFVKEKVDNAILFQKRSPLSRQHHTAELWRHWLGRTEAM
jgi:hypothetical protein